MFILESNHGILYGMFDSEAAAKCWADNNDISVAAIKLVANVDTGEYECP